MPTSYRLVGPPTAQNPRRGQRSNLRLPSIICNALRICRRVEVQGATGNILPPGKSLAPPKIQGGDWANIAEQAAWKARAGEVRMACQML